MEYGLISRIDLPDARELTERIVQYMQEYADICVEERTADHSELDNSIDPQVSAHVIVPIAPYKLSTRPLVVPADKEIRIHEVEGRASILVIDGQHETRVEEETISFTRSPKTARFIRFNTNFYERVRAKFLR